MRHAPTEQEVAKRGLKDATEPNFLALLLISLVATVAVSGGAWLLRSVEIPWLNFAKLDAIVNHRGMVQYVELVMAFLLAGTAAGKYRLLRPQWGDLATQPLAGVDLRGDQNLQAFRQKLAADPRFEKSLLLSRLHRGIGLWLGSKDLERLGEWMEAESRRETAASDSSFALARYFIWAIPIMGFIGTVLGLARAVGGFSVLGTAPDLISIKNAIGQVTMGLGVAFETTLLALVLTIPLMLLLTFVQRDEEKLLVELDNYLDQTLLTRLPSSEKNPIVIENLEDSLEAAFRRYIPDPDRYEEVFTRSIERAGASVEARFANLARDYAATLRDLTSQLGEHLAAVTEVTAQAVGNMLNQVREVGRDETDRFRSMLVEIESKSGAALADYQKAAEKFQTASAGASSELAARLGEVSRLAASVQNLLRVEQAVEKGLQDITAGQELQKTLAELRRHLDATTTLCQQLGKPRQFTLHEIAAQKE